jgi:hypothetical protein
MFRKTSSSRVDSVDVYLFASGADTWALDVSIQKHVLVFPRRLLQEPMPEPLASLSPRQP